MENCNSTLTNSLFLNIIKSVDNFILDINEKIENTDNFCLKADIMRIESFLFCLYLLALKLKTKNKLNISIDAEKLVNIIADLLSKFIDEKKSKENIPCLKSLSYFLELYENRFDIYNKLVINGIENTIQYFINIINCELEQQNIIDKLPDNCIEKLPLDQDWGVIFRGSFELFDKTIKDIENIVEKYF